MIRCALVQIGSDLPMDRPVEEIKAALNDKCAGLIADGRARGARIAGAAGALQHALLRVGHRSALVRRRRARPRRSHHRADAGAGPPARDGHRGAALRAGRRRPLQLRGRQSTPTGGSSGVYRKHHVPSPHAGNYEPFYFHQPDVGFPVFETAYGRVGVYICYDRHFPEIARIYGVRARGDRLQSLGHGRSPVRAGVGARAAGSRAGQRLLRRRPEPRRPGPALRQRRSSSGKSYFCNPLGELIAQAGRGVEEVLIADLDLDEIQSSRESWHTNRLYLDRRPATYHEMLAEGIPASEARKGESPVAHPQRSIHYVPIMTDEMKAAAVRALEDGRADPLLPGEGQRRRPVRGRVLRVHGRQARRGRQLRASRRSTSR